MTGSIATRSARPLPDRLELRFPRVFRSVTRAAIATPRAPLHRAMIGQAIDRAQDAFNRGDLEVIFATFAPDAEYVPPPPLGGPDLIVGREAALRYWRGVFSEWRDNRIENLSLSLEPGLITREARLSHVNRRTSERLEYRIRQLTKLRSGVVISQVNHLLTD